MENELNEITTIVEKILTDNPATRDDDILLYREVLKFKIPDALTLLVDEFLNKYKELKIPNVSSVSRIRRKLQENNEELRGSNYIQMLRRKAEQEYKVMMRNM